MNHTLITIIGCSITFLATIIGSCIVFFIKNNFSTKVTAIINGFSAGVMIAASIWGLILPSFEQSKHLENLYFLPTVAGIIIGCLFLSFIDIIVKSINKKNNNSQLIDGKNKLIRFISAFTVHNIPEGLAVGFAFGSALNIGSDSAMIVALSLAIAIAIQNIPEGIAVALPVYKATGSKKKGFLWSILSGSIEPVFAVVGIILATQIEPLLPWLLSFAAGAMIFVSIDDLIPDGKRENSSLGAWSFMIGFILMMLLDLI